MLSAEQLAAELNAADAPKTPFSARREALESRRDTGPPPRPRPETVSPRMYRTRELKPVAEPDRSARFERIADALAFDALPLGRFVMLAGQLERDKDFPKLKTALVLMTAPINEPDPVKRAQALKGAGEARALVLGFVQRVFATPGRVDLETAKAALRTFLGLMVEVRRFATAKVAPLNDILETLD